MGCLVWEIYAIYIQLTLLIVLTSNNNYLYLISMFSISNINQQWSEQRQCLAFMATAHSFVSLIEAVHMCHKPFVLEMNIRGKGFTWGWWAQPNVIYIHPRMYVIFTHAPVSEQKGRCPKAPH